MSISTFFLCLCSAAALCGVHAGRDTLLFEIALSGDSTTLLYCKRGGESRRMLSGPIVMDGGRLLFYSENGYVLFDQTGAVIDSHSVFGENRSMGPDDPRRLVCAQPISATELLYVRRTVDGDSEVVIYRKRLLRNRLRELNDEERARYAEVAKARVFNLAHNARTDEMSTKGYLRPYLVGFGAGRDAPHWWTLDKFYSFSSPVIHENDGAYESFFPGVKASVDASREVKRELVEPLATYVRDGLRYYVGVYAMLGTTKECYRQRLYVCDEAGNILSTDTLLKQTNTDVVLGEVKEEKMLYTARQTARYVFQPSVSPGGTVYYGIVDYEKNRIAVRRRSCAAYRPHPTAPNLAHLIDIEKAVEYEPVSIGCTPAQQGGSQIPRIRFVDERGRKRSAIPKDLERDGFLVRIFRQQYRDVERKLARRRLPFPDQVQTIRDSLASKRTAGCPYAISLSGPRGVHRSFDYPPAQRVLCARVLSVLEDGRVLVRVDLENYAEVLVFATDGRFVNRFTFNRQPHDTRRDIIVAHGRGQILELDYEADRRAGEYFSWAAVDCEE